MKNKTVNTTLISLIIIIFIAYFSTLHFGFDNDITRNLSLIETAAINQDWDKALELSKSTKNNWESKRRFIMLNYAEAELSIFENHINSIIGGATAQELDSVISNVLSAKHIWSNMNKIVPKP